VTIIPLTIGLLSGGRVSLDSRKSEVEKLLPGIGIERKNRDSRLPSLVNIPSFLVTQVPVLVQHYMGKD